MNHYGSIRGTPKRRWNRFLKCREHYGRISSYEGPYDEIRHYRIARKGYCEYGDR